MSGTSSTEGEIVEFACDVCSKPFKSKYSMERHIRIIHDGVMPYRCECGKCFGTQDQYQKHFVSKHSNLKPIKCNRGCDKYFTTINARYYHNRVYHENVRHKCMHEGCKRSYTSATLLNGHVERVHNSNPSIEEEVYGDSNRDFEDKQPVETKNKPIQEKELEEWEKMINYFYFNNP